MAHILVFGDSIVWGAGANIGWADKLKILNLKKAVETEFEDYDSLYNLGIPGDNSQMLLKRIEGEIKARVEETGGEILILIAIGVNDSQFDNQKKVNWVSKKDYLINLRKFVKIVKGLNGRVIFIGLTPVLDLMVDPIPWKSTHSYKLGHIKEYDRILKEFCRRDNIEFIEMLERFLEKGVGELVFDGVHPNQKGHDLIFEIVRKYLEESKRN